MNCPNCGSELNENQKFCTNCGAKIGNSDMPESINIKWVVISLVAVVLVFGTCIIATQNNNLPVDTKENNEVIEDTTTVDDTTEYPEEEEEEQEPQRPITPKPKCIYETSDGVCFTTQIFKVTPMDYYNCTGGWTTYEVERPAGEEARSYGITLCKYKYDNWAGATKMCGDWGYKLPSEYDLTSLAKDIFGINISNVPNERSYVPNQAEVNTVPIKALNLYAAPNALWEDTEESSSSAYIRGLGFLDTFNKGYTERFIGSRYYNVTTDRAICVYDPYGVAKTKYVPPKPKPVQTSNPEPPVQQAPAADEKYNKEAENALF